MEREPKEAHLIYKETEHKLYAGGIVVELGTDDATIEFMRVFRLTAAQVGEKSALEVLLGCTDCPIYYQDAPDVEGFVHPYYGFRKEKPGVVSTVDIGCAGHSKRSITKASGPENLPCIKKFKDGQKVNY